MNRLWAASRVGLTSLLVLGVAASASAQSAAARVEGLVTDDTGATVPGAAVTATNLGTSAARSVVTDGRGEYVLTPLPAGEYRVQVELTGFKTAATRASLTVSQVARIDLTLEVGGASEVVDVRGAMPLIEKSTSFIGTVIDSKQVENLPLNGRNFTQLATLSPGVNRGTPGGNASGEAGNAETFRYGEVGGAALSVNGIREQGNSYLLDGVDNNESLVNSLVFFPPVEALQEFRVITSNAPAEFGRSGGGIVSAVTKSGTNQFHGSVYEFNRSKGLASKPEFAAEKPEFSRNQFGATVGGPLVKDRTFFFASYSGLRSTIPVEAGGRVTVPTARMRNGDFSELLNPAFTGIGRAIIVYDPRTNTPFPGNVIPRDRLNPVAVAYLGAFPLPDLTDRAQQNYFTRRERKSDFNDYDLRFDHAAGTNDSLFLRLSYADDHRFDPGRIPGFQAGFGSGTAEAEGIGGALGHTHTFSANVVNELRIGVNRYRYAFLPVGFGEDQNRALGIPGPGGVTRPNGISLIGGGNGSFIEYLGDFGQYVVRQKTYQIADALTVIRGRHTLKAGGSVLLRNVEMERTNFGKGFYFFPDATSPEPGRTGYEVAEMLIGTTAFTATGVPGFTPRSTRNWENSLFVQDDFRLSPKMTLNLGLRYEVFTPYYEQDDQLGNFQPVFGPSGVVTGGALVQAGRNGASRSTVDTDWNNLGPRVGVAYQLDGHTVLRGSYGIFYGLDRGGIDNQLTENPPAVVTQFRFGGTGANVRLSDPIPLPVAIDPGNPVLPDGSGIVYTPRDTKTNRVQQWNVSAQRELTSYTAATLAYVGTRGNNLTAVTSVAGFGGAVSGRLTTVANVASSKYDSLQVSVRRNQANGLSYLASYTFGHATNDSPGPFPGPGGNFVSTPTDARNLGLDEGNADYDLRHRFTFAATYELPFARENAILGGWAVNSIVTLQTGNYFTVFAGGRRADLVAGQDPNDGPREPERWFNSGAFRPAAGDVPTSGRNLVEGPGLRSIDLSLFKTFKFSGRYGLELRIEGFNVLDTPQYGFPNQFVDQAAYGTITTTRLNSERQIQLATRLTF